MNQLLRGLMAALPRLGQPLVLVSVLAAAGLIAAAVLLRPMLPTWGWLLSLLVLALGIAVGAIVKALPWYRQRRFIRAHDGVVADGETAPGRGLERRLVAARDVILHSPNLSAGRDPLYRLPWYLVLGADDAAVQGVLRPPLADSPFPEPDAAGERVWSWWFYNGLVAVQLPAAFVCEPQQTEVRATWYQALRLLDRHRPKLPANGIILVLGAAALTGPQDALRETCTRLRRLIDEALRLLQIDAPVYVVVAGCETLPGFAAFARALPDEARRRALGHRFTAGAEAGRAFKEWLVSGFDELRRTLHATRLGLLRERTEARTQQVLFGFVETFAQLRDGLAQAGAVLFEDNPYQRRPWLAGVFFTGAESFAGDLFGRFLPADQPLAHKRRRSRLLSWGTALALAGLLLSGSALLGFWIFTTSHEIERLVAAAEGACAAEPQPAQAVAALDACREAITRLDAARSGAPFYPGLRRASRAEEALKGRYAASYANLILEPLERAFDSGTQRRALRFADHLALARRYALVRQCLEERECATLDAAPVFETALAADLPGLGVPGMLPTLAFLHRTELLWAGGNALAVRKDLLAARLEMAYRAQPPTVADVVAWAADRAAPIRLTAFWRRPAPERAPQVAPAFSRAQWMEGPARLASDLAGAGVAPVVRTLVADYLGRYAGTWQEFLADFDRGALAWSDDVPGLVALLGGDDSPYLLLWRTLDEELFALNGESAMPAWPKALATTLGGPWREVEPKLRTLFFELTEDPDGARGYQLATAVYGGGMAPDPTVAAFREVQAALESPPADSGPLSLEGQRAWRVVRQPLSLWLRIVNHRAGAYLDRMWREQVMEPARAQPERQRQAFLFGPDGRIAAFRATLLRPLLAEGGAAAQLGVAPPVAAEFQAFLDSTATDRGQGEPIYAGRLSIPRPAQFGSVAGDPGSTSFTLSCLTGNQTASDASPQQAVITLAWSPDTCFDVRITVSVPTLLAGEDQRAPTLVRTYAGPQGFLDFIADFRSGPKTVSLGQFSVPPDARSALASHGITRITVPIEFELSEIMRAWLAKPAAAELPLRVSASAFDSSSVNGPPQ